MNFKEFNYMTACKIKEGAVSLDDIRCSTMSGIQKCQIAYQLRELIADIEVVNSKNKPKTRTIREEYHMEWYSYEEYVGNDNFID